MPGLKPVWWWACLAVLLMVSPLPSAAQTVPGCPPLLQYNPGFEPIFEEEETDTAPPLTRLRADRLESVGEQTFILSGHAEVQRQGQRIRADEITYDRKTGELDASGDVTFDDIGGDLVRTPELHLDFEQFTGYAGGGSYRLGRNQGRGDTGTIELEGPQLLDLYNARYTTCPPGNNDWFFSTRHLTLDKSRNVGTARHAVLKFKQTPIFYWPWVRFPISNERQTGFLFPEVGHSSNLGTTFAWPFYWNIAPNFDDTVTPRWLSQRGLQTQNEFRYLGRPFKGQLDTEYLADDHKTGAERWAAHYTHHQTVGTGWTGDVNYAKVSDDNYLSDFHNNIGITSLSFLPQDAHVNYSGSVWSFGARALGYQTIDPTIASSDRPYDQLPQLTLAARPATVAGRLNPLFQSELVNFQREDSVTGRRLDLLLGAGLPFRRAYGFVTPKFSVQHIGYHLDNVQAMADTQPDVDVPIYSLDSGLYFERDMQSRRGSFIQTLEPRFFYLNVPFRNQDDLPNFDTSLPDLSYANLFRENRFVGGDRVGDANQATLGVTTRLLDAEDGAELMSFSIGEILYFADRKVNLAPGTVETANTSDLVAEFTAKVADKWYGRTTVEWNYDNRQMEKENLFFQYEPQIDRIFNFGYSFDRDDFKQLDISTQWPLKGRWTVTASTAYSLVDNRNVQSYAGLEYRSCCWAVRFFARRRLDSEQNQVSDVLFQFELTGLGHIGDIPESPLVQSVFFTGKRSARGGLTYP